MTQEWQQPAKETIGYFGMATGRIRLPKRTLMMAIEEFARSRMSNRHGRQLGGAAIVQLRLFSWAIQRRSINE